MLLLPCLNASAMALAEGVNLDRAIPVETGIETLVDPAGILTIEDVSAGAASASFAPASAGKIDKPRKNVVIWVRFSLSRDVTLPKDWILALSPTWLDDVTLYSRVNNADGSQGAFTAMRIGDRFPFSQRSIQSVSPSFPVAVDTAAQTYYLRLQTHGPVLMKMALWQYTALFEKEEREVAFYSFLIGGFTVVIFINVVFFMFLRASMYWMLPALMLAAFASLFFQSGFGALVFPEGPLLNDRLTDITVCTLALTNLWLSNRFFSFRHHYRWGYRLVLGLLIFFALAIVAIVAGQADDIMAWAIDLGLTSAFLNCALLITLARTKRQDPRAPHAMVLGGFNFAWGLYGASQIGYLPSFQLGIPNMLPAALAGFFLFTSFAIIRQSLLAEKQLYLAREKTLESTIMARKAIKDSEQQRRFVAIVSHEFRTPLAIINAVAHALASSPAGHDEQVKSSMAKIRRAISRLSLLVDNILVNNNLENFDTQTTTMVDLDVRLLIQNCNAVVLAKESARLRLELPATPLIVNGNAFYLETILSNLLENALKYAREGSQVELRASTHKHWARIDVCNEGPAIPEAERDALFTPYFRGSTAGKEPGSGLGLHIAQTIARRHGGDLLLYASDGRQTVFRLLLPLSGRRHDNG